MARVYLKNSWELKQNLTKKKNVKFDLSDGHGIIVFIRGKVKVTIIPNGESPTIFGGTFSDLDKLLNKFENPELYIDDDE